MQQFHRLTGSEAPSETPDDEALPAPSSKRLKRKLAAPSLGRLRDAGRPLRESDDAGISEILLYFQAAGVACVEGIGTTPGVTSERVMALVANRAPRSGSGPRSAERIARSALRRLFFWTFRTAKTKRKIEGSPTMTRRAAPTTNVTADLGSPALACNRNLRLTSNPSAQRLQVQSKRRGRWSRPRRPGLQSKWGHVVDSLEAIIPIYETGSSRIALFSDARMREEVADSR